MFDSPQERSCHAWPIKQNLVKRLHEHCAQIVFVPADLILLHVSLKMIISSVAAIEVNWVGHLPTHLPFRGRHYLYLPPLVSAQHRARLAAFL